MDNNEICCICQTADDSISVETECKHKFHKDCLMEIIRPSCPLCKANITNTLISIGITKEDIEKRIEDDDIRICCDELRGAPIEEIEFDEFLVMTIDSIKNNSEWFYVYRDIILDMISNAGINFQEISKIKHEENKPGIFLYHFDVSDFILQNIEQHAPSIALWIPLEDLKDSEFYEIAVDLHNKITNTKYGVLILFEQNIEDIKTNNNIYACPRIMSSDTAGKKKFIANSKGNGYNAGIRKSRISQKDILKSIINCSTCRSDGPAPYEHNREYSWSKNYLKNMKNKKKKKNILKKNVKINL